MKKKFLSIIFAAVMATCGVFAAGCGKENKTTNKTPTGEEDIVITKPIEDTIPNAVRPGGEYKMTSAMSFLSSDLEPVAQANEGVSVVVGCEVYPTDAENKEVDWYIEWASDATLKTNPVSNYVTVTPMSDGNTKAVVTCYQSFGSDTIILRVVTRDGGFEDYCYITFVGIPSSITLSTNMSTSSQATQGGTVTYYELGTNTTQTMTVTLGNAFNSVDESFYDQITYSVEGPEIYVADETYTTDGDGNTTCEKTNEKEIDLADIYSKLFSISRSGHTFTLKGFKVIENYYTSRNYGARGYLDTEKFQGYVYTNGYKWFTVTVSVGTLMKTFHLRTVTGVTSVKVESTFMEF